MKADSGPVYENWGTDVASLPLFYRWKNQGSKLYELGRGSQQVGGGAGFSHPRMGTQLCLSMGSSFPQLLYPQSLTEFRDREGGFQGVTRAV